MHVYIFLIWKFFEQRLIRRTGDPAFLIFFIKKEDDNTITITMYTTYFWETPQNIIFLSEKIVLLPPAIYMGFVREMNTYLR